MKKMSKATLLVSTALLLWAESLQPTVAMDSKKEVDLAQITIQSLPSSALSSKASFFEYLDSLKNGKNDAIIEGSKQVYVSERRPAHAAKLQAALAYLTTTHGATKDYSEELTKTREEAKKHEQEITKITNEKVQVEQKAELERKAFSQTTGMSVDQILGFILHLQKSLSGFSDALFLMKFSGDQNKDFSTTLAKIISQAEASKKVKDAYEADQKIKKLEIYLQLPSEKVDTTPLVGLFQKNQVIFFRGVSEKLEQFMSAWHNAKTQFENIESASGFSQLSSGAQKSFKNYRYGTIGEMDEFGVAKEVQKYKDIFEGGNKLGDFFNKLLMLLKENFATPLDFKEKFEEFSKENQGLLSNVFDSVIGTENTQEERTLLINRSGLSLYRYLDLQIANHTIKGPLAGYIQQLLQSIDLMRVRAFELATEIQEGAEFVKSTDETVDVVLLTTGVKSLNAIVNDYEIAEGENALIDNLQHFMLPTREQWVDYEKLKDFKIARDEENTQILKDLEIYSKKWMDLANAREDLCTVKSIKTLAAIIQSNLYDDPEKVRLLTEISQAGGAQKKRTATIRFDSYITKVVENKFAVLNKRNTLLKNLLKLFEEKIALTEARNDKNAKAEKNNLRPGLSEKEKQKIEETPPLTLENMELVGAMHSSVKMNKKLSFDEFWNLVEHVHDSPIAQFMGALSMQPHKEEFKHLCQSVFKWVKEDTSERKSLNALFEKVIVAHDHHIGFMNKMGEVSLAFQLVQPHLPQYSLDQQTIENKVKELEHLITQKPGLYLISEPNFRAVNYAYNFPMFSDKDLQPLKPEMEIWGTAQKPQVLKLLATLRAAHTAYIQARDAIKAINPAAEDRGIRAKLFGGFEQEIVLIQTSEPQSKKTQAVKSTWTKKVTKPFPDKLVDLCNHCVLEIESLVKTKVATHDDLNPYMSTAKETMLHQIIILLQDRFKFLDQPVPEEAEVENMITQACEYVKTQIDAMISEVHEALQGKPSKSSKSVGQQGEIIISGIQPKRSLKSVQPSSKASDTSSESPFQIKLKSHSSEKKETILTAMEIAEKEIAAIQPAGATEVLKKQADAKRLEKIKDFLVKEKDAGFVKGFADEELLAFPLWTFDALVSHDLENLQEGFHVGHLGNRKFSSKALEVIKGIRFNKNEHESIKGTLLTSDNVKKETPKELLGTTLQVSTTIMNGLIGDGDIK